MPTPDKLIIKKVKDERAKYERDIEEENIRVQTELENKDKLVPVTQISNRNVLNLFKEYYPPEILEHLTIENDKINSLVTSLKTLNKNCLKICGPLQCIGPECYAAERCALQKAGIAPIGNHCSIELLLMDQWEEEYINDLGVDTHSKIEIDLVRDMIEADLMDWRTSNEIAKGGLFDWNAIGMTEDGKPIYRKEESVAISIKLKFKNRKDRLREDLMATRKMKAKFGLAKTLDPSKFAATLQERYNAIRDANAEVVDEEDQMENPKEFLDD